MIFSSSGPGGKTNATRRVEEQMNAAGIIEHVDEDVDDVVNTVCVGVELIDGQWWWPPAEKLWTMLLATMNACETKRTASPAGLLALLGVLQWFDFLRRPKLAFHLCLHF